MYSKQETSLTRSRFWTLFGQYMRPVKNAAGETTNWINYKTGTRDIYFRMDAGGSEASIAIELKHREGSTRHEYFDRLSQVRDLFTGIMGESWDWHVSYVDEHGRELSRISKTLKGVTVFNEANWPSIISFLKPRIIALDEFWQQVKDLVQ